MASVPSTLSCPTLLAPRRSRVGVASTSMVAISALALLAGLTGTARAAPPVSLGDAESFAVLAGAGITNSGTTVVSGDIGSFATTSIDGGITLAPGSTNRGGSVETQDGKTALSAALVAAAGAGPQTTVAGGLLGGQVLGAGVYNSGSTLDLTGVLTLDGGGSYDSVFVFQAGSDLITSSSSSVQLLNGAQACNIFWQVGSSATLGSDSLMSGTILADTAISLGTRAEVQGRVLASTAAVSLLANVITRPDTCLTGLVAPPVVAPPVVAPPVVAPPVAPSSSTPPTTAASSSAPMSRTTFGQVGRVPVGSVDTGDGSTS